jgi:hypothetical protein
MDTTTLELALQDLEEQGEASHFASKMVHQ